MEYPQQKYSNKSAKKHNNLGINSAKLRYISFNDLNRNKNSCKDLKSYIPNNYNYKRNRQYRTIYNKTKGVTIDNDQLIFSKILSKFELLNKKIKDLSNYTNCLLANSNDMKRKINNNHDIYMNNMNKMNKVDNMNNINNINNNIYIDKKLCTLWNYNRNFDNFQQFSKNLKKNKRRLFRNHKCSKQQLLYNKISVFNNDSLNRNLAKYKYKYKYSTYANIKLKNFIKNNSEENLINYKNFQYNRNNNNNNKYFAKINEIDSRMDQGNFFTINTSNISNDLRKCQKFFFNKYAYSQDKNLHSDINNKNNCTNIINFNVQSNKINLKNNRMHHSPIGRFDSFFTHKSLNSNISNQTQLNNTNNKNNYEKYKYNTINVDLNPINNCNNKYHSDNFNIQKSNEIILNSRNISLKNVRLQITSPTHLSFVSKKNKNKKLLAKTEVIEFTLNSSKNNNSEKKSNNNHSLDSREIKDLCLQKLSDLICEVEQDNKKNEKKEIDKKNIKIDMNYNNKNKMSSTQKKLKKK